MLLSETKLIIIISLFIFFRNALRRLPGRSRGGQQREPCCSGEMGGEGGNFKDEFFLRDLKSGGRGHDGGRGRGGKGGRNGRGRGRGGGKVGHGARRNEQVINIRS